MGLASQGDDPKYLARSLGSPVKSMVQRRDYRVAASRTGGGAAPAVLPPCESDREFCVLEIVDPGKRSMGAAVAAGGGLLGKETGGRRVDSSLLP